MISSLYPPNNSVLRDIVIGGVVDRIVSNNCRQRHNPSRLESFGLSLVVPPSPTAPQYLPHPRQASASTEELQPKAKKLPKRRTPYSRREQCRINQAQYRSRQRKYEEVIKLSISQLKKEIRDLEVEERAMRNEIPITRNIWVVATEYFYFFQNGCSTPLKRDDGAFKPLAQQPQLQLPFLRKTMALDVAFGVDHGVEAIFENWKLFSLYDDVRVRIQRMEQVTTDSLLTNVIVSLTITLKTLQYLYPHLIYTSEEETTALTAKLLNQRLQVRGSVFFDWDNTSECFIRLESKFDMMSPILKLLGSLEDVARVFDKASMTPEGGSSRLIK